jgi:hypothetical protein
MRLERRLEALGKELIPRPEASRAPKTSMRMVVTSAGGGPANLAKSTCLRYIRNDCLTEVVELHGDDSGISDQQLEEFIAGFPIAMPERTESR